MVSFFLRETLFYNVTRLEDKNPCVAHTSGVPPSQFHLHPPRRGRPSSNVSDETPNFPFTSRSGADRAPVPRTILPSPNSPAEAGQIELQCLRRSSKIPLFTRRSGADRAPMSRTILKIPIHPPKRGRPSSNVSDDPPKFPFTRLIPTTLICKTQFDNFLLSPPLLCTCHLTPAAVTARGRDRGDRGASLPSSPSSRLFLPLR